MRIKIFTVLAIFVFAFSCIASASKSSDLISVEEIFKKPEKAGFQLSLDGSHLSWLAPYKTRMNIFVMDLETKKEKRLTSMTHRDIPHYVWLNKEVIGFIMDKGGDENFKLYGVNIKTGKEICYTPFDEVRTGLIDDLEEEPDHVLIAMNKRDKKVMDVFRLTLSTGELEEVARNDGTIIGWITDWNGKLRGAWSKVNNRDLILTRENEKEAFQPFYIAPEGDKFSPVAFDFDNSGLIVKTNVNRDKEAFVRISAGGNEVETLFAHPEVDAGAVIISKYYKKIMGFGYYTDKLHHKILDEELNKIIKRLKIQNLDKTVSFQDADRTYSKLLFYIGGDTDPGAYYLFDKESQKLTLLVETMPWLKKANLCKSKPIKYLSRDGKTELNGYLTLPKSASKGKVPLIINPHGGPASRDGWGFNPEVQLLANRGYAVLQVNFRGSTGYGKRFQDLGIKQWGKGFMQHDLSDGVQWAINQGIAKEDKVAIYGGSYGGYAALAGMTFTPELYACGVSYVGPSSLLTLLNSVPPYWKPIIKDLYRRVGDPVKDKDFLKSISPLFFVENIVKPLFVVQGAQDPRVKKQESDQIVEAMKKNGLEVFYMVKENEGHGFRNQENQIEFYKSLEAFLSQYLGGKSLTRYSEILKFKK